MRSWRSLYQREEKMSIDVCQPCLAFNSKMDLQPDGWGRGAGG